MLYHPIFFRSICHLIVRKFCSLNMHILMVTANYIGPQADGEGVKDIVLTMSVEELLLDGYEMEHSFSW